jgi:hypothetical protein
MEADMLSRMERARARARETLQNLTPAPFDSLLKAEEEATAILEEARRAGVSGPDEVAASLMGEVSQGYYRYLVERRARRPKG